MVGNSHHMLFTQHNTYYLLPRVHGIGNITRTIKKQEENDKKSKRNFSIWTDWKVYFHHPETTHAFPNTEMTLSSICGQRVTMNSMTIARESGS